MGLRACCPWAAAGSPALDFGPFIVSSPSPGLCAFPWTQTKMNTQDQNEERKINRGLQKIAISSGEVFYYSCGDGVDDRTNSSLDFLTRILRRVALSFLAIGLSTPFLSRTEAGLVPSERDLLALKEIPRRNLPHDQDFGGGTPCETDIGSAVGFE